MTSLDNGWIIACKGECEAQTCEWVSAKKAIEAWNHRTSTKEETL